MARRQTEPHRRAGYRDRVQKTRELRQRFLIVCEGSKTEPFYFRAFKAPRSVVDLDVRGVAFDPLKLVKETISIQEQEIRAGTLYEQVWCVFDRDSWPLDNFKDALALAKRRKFHVAYSNEAFELWYLLHFDYHDTAISRDSYKNRLTANLGFEYQKNSPHIYEHLLKRQSTAVTYATNLLATCYPVDPANDNPSTTVHLLVQELNKHSRP